MRYVLILLCMLWGAVPSANAQISIGIGLPDMNIGISFSSYPEFERVPGYPVYYAPRLNSNYFFYDGMYWVYQGDNWYASSWYNGPWGQVGPEYVPLYVLRIPVRYYRNRPEYFRGWRSDAPPRWGEHWGNDWEQKRHGWDKWNRSSAPAPAPLPVYQRKYSGDRYPRQEQQHELRNENYRYQPRDAVVKQHYQEHAAQRPPAPREQQKAPQKGREEVQRPAPTQAPQQKGREEVQRPAPTQAPQQKGREEVQRPAPTQAPQQKGREDVQRSAPTQAPAQQKGQEQRQQQPQGKGASQDSKRGQEQEKDRGKGDERGQDHNK